MSDKSRVLLLSYHFPPSNAAGANRWDAFTRYAVAHGVEFDVLTAGTSSSWAKEHAAAPIRVFALPDGFSRSERAANSALGALKSLRSHRDVPQKSPAETVPATQDVPQQVFRRDQLRWLPLTTSSLRAGLRSWLKFTAHSPWADAAVRAAQRLRLSTQYRCVISSGPPFASHMAARRIAKDLGAPLILDFRDPWSAQNAVPWEIASPLWFSLSGHAERACIEAASLIVMNTERAAQAMRAIYPNERIETVPNGYSGTPAAPAHPPDTFSVLYAGAVYLDRDPRPLLAGLALAVNRAEVAPGALRLRFIGECDSYAGMPLADLASAHGLSEYVEIHPPVSRKELARYLQEAAMLVVLPQSATLAIPSKVYENLYQHAWVLALEPEDTATRSLLEQTGVDIVEPHDVERIARVFEERLRAYRNGVRPTPAVKDDRYRVEQQATRFLTLVQSVVPRAQA